MPVTIRCGLDAFFVTPFEEKHAKALVIALFPLCLTACGGAGGSHHDHG